MWFLVHVGFGNFAFLVGLLVVGRGCFGWWRFLAGLLVVGRGCFGWWRLCAFGATPLFVSLSVGEVFGWTGWTGGYIICARVWREHVDVEGYIVRSAHVWG